MMLPLRLLIRFAIDFILDFTLVPYYKCTLVVAHLLVCSGLECSPSFVLQERW